MRRGAPCGRWWAVSGIGHDRQDRTVDERPPGACSTTCAAGRVDPDDAVTRCAACPSPTSASPGSTTTAAAPGPGRGRLRAGQDPEQCAGHRRPSCSVAGGGGPGAADPGRRRAGRRALAANPGGDRTAPPWCGGPRPRAARAGGGVTAGTADLPVADECAAVLAAHGFDPAGSPTSGVAGLHRLLGRRRRAGRRRRRGRGGRHGGRAGVSLVGGITGAPVVAVPTSVGYGAGLEGVTALLAMLSSCAAGVTVVGIDNGFGAACAVPAPASPGRWIARRA
jgi:pyridinium-3,5-biscarboxylic acid mononucleotide synthase